MAEIRTDRECVRLCLDGHPEVFAELVHRYRAALLSYVLGRLGDMEAAEEVVQEAFVRSYQSLRKLVKPDAFLPWLFGIAGRVIKEERRHRRRTQELAASLSVQPKDSPRSHDFELEKAVAALEPPYRNVVLLRYYSGMSCAEVAAHLGMPIGTVTKTLSRAYAMLRASLVPRDRDEFNSTEERQ